MDDFDAGFDRGEESVFETLAETLYGKDSYQTLAEWAEEAGE